MRTDVEPRAGADAATLPDDVPDWFRDQHREWLDQRRRSAEESDARWRTQQRYGAGSGAVVGFLSAIYLNPESLLLGPALAAGGALAAWWVVRKDVSMPLGGIYYGAPMIVLTAIAQTLGWADSFRPSFLDNEIFWIWQLYVAFGVALAYLTERERNEFLPY